MRSDRAKIYARAVVDLLIAAHHVRETHRQEAVELVEEKLAEMSEEDESGE